MGLGHGIDVILVSVIGEGSESETTDENLDKPPGRDGRVLSEYYVHTEKYEEPRTHCSRRS